MPQPLPPPASTLRDLVGFVARLRADDGCPWDREQTLAQVRAYLIEEAHEAAAALDDGDWRAIAGELGDLLFQVAFVLRLGEEAGALRAEAVVGAVQEKLVARHPHVFGEAVAADAAAVARAWEQRKAAVGEGSLLAGVPVSLPALVGAYRLSQKAAGVGFDWPDARSVLAKVHEELAEVELEMAPDAERHDEAGSAHEATAAALEGEIGDLLFAVANLARKAGIDPERALAATNGKFRRRFAHVEQGVRARGRVLGEVTLDELEELWQEAKRQAPVSAAPESGASGE
jgi:ATP diphosphatase